MGFMGLDVVAIQALARQLDGQAQEVDSLAKELSTALDAANWFGADQRAFLEEWNSTHRPGLQNARHLLAEASALARENAKAQERASGGGR